MFNIFAGAPQLVPAEVKTSLRSAYTANDQKELQKILKQYPTAVNEAIDGGKTILMKACIEFRIPIVNLALEQKKLEINKKDESNQEMTALMYAADVGNVEIFRLLLSHKKIDVNQVDSTGRTALYIAVFGKHSEIVRLLLEHPDLDVNAANNSGGTALIICAEQGLTSLMKRLLSHPRININLQLNSGETALDMACLYNSVDCVKLLLQRSDLNTQSTNREGKTALTWASFKGHIEIVELLLKDRRVRLDYASQGHDSLLIAAENGKMDVLNLLLNQPSLPVNARSIDSGESALSMACWHNQVQIVKALLKRRDIDVNITNKDGVTPLMIAIQNGNREIAQSLLNIPSINRSLIDKNKMSALSRACGSNYPEILEQMLRGRERDINLMDGIVPLVQAAQDGKHQNVKLLLQYPNIDPNAFVEGGYSPLQAAAVKGAMECLSLIADHPKTNPNLVTGSNWTALNLASTRNQLASVEFLLSKFRGVIDVNIPEANGFTPLKNASYHGFPHIIAKLLTHPQINQAMRNNANVAAVLDVCCKSKSANQMLQLQIVPLFMSLPPPDPSLDSPARIEVTAEREGDNEMKGEMTSYDAFISHDWGTDKENHRKVALINAALKKMGFKTWFDEEQMHGNIYKRMTEGIERSKACLVFITENYRNKVNGDDERDNCFFEFGHATEQLGPQKMIAIVMEPSMRNPRNWKGVLGARLGKRLYHDFSSVSDQHSFQELVEQIASELKDLVNSE